MTCLEPRTMVPRETTSPSMHTLVPLFVSPLTYSSRRGGERERLRGVHLAKEILESRRVNFHSKGAAICS